MKQRNKQESKHAEKTGEEDDKKKNVAPKFGPLGLKYEHQAWSRAILFTGIVQFPRFPARERFLIYHLTIVQA